MWGLWHGKAVAGQHRTSSAISIERVGFALAAPRRAVGTVDLDDVNVVDLQCLCQACTVGAGALNTDSDDLAETTRPADRGPVAARVGTEFGIAKQSAGIGDRSHVDGVEVGVSADDDAAWGCHDGGVLSVQ
ncbi:hypothetical protein MGAD_04910 [Mycolicibacterium gadium]|uniref:Uncharacterized protein n=1 Tax=Mycolicibacterium gadium TaxID=1794 RepID=A0A7I7WEY0_MYCGU|nr:hypothetical protein MGAD_04910 [Mycolicibacterium gadium]